MINKTKDKGKFITCLFTRDELETISRAVRDLACAANGGSKFEKDLHQRILRTLNPNEGVHFVERGQDDEIDQGFLPYCSSIVPGWDADKEPWEGTTISEKVTCTICQGYVASCSATKARNTKARKK